MKFSFSATLVTCSVPIALILACGSSADSTFQSSSGEAASGGESSSGGGNTGFGTSGNASSSGEQPRPCEGLECKQVACANGGTTSLSGTVFAPNGTLPIYNAIVYVPNAAVEAFTDKGVTCDKCGTTPSGKPVATALSDADGKFKLTNVPTGDNIPLVVQIGKWRRQITIPNVPSCTDTALAADNTRLPRNKTEGDIPKIALTTGGADSLECFFRKLGVDQSEFTTDSGAGRIHMFNGVRRNARCERWTTQGTPRWVQRNFSECNAAEINKPEWAGANPNTNNADYRIVPIIEDGITSIAAQGGAPAETLPPATNLWGSGAGGTTGFSCAASGFADNKRCSSAGFRSWQAGTSRLKEYDMVILSCEGDENNGTKDEASRAALREYMDAGGRVFNSHFHYTWFKNPTGGANPLTATATWTGNGDRGDRSTRIDQSFAKGQAFAHWLVTAGAATRDATDDSVNSDMKELRKNVVSVPASSRRWIYEPGDSDAVKFYSFNMPLGSAAEAQCGRAVYTDIHVSSGDQSGGTFPNNCTTLSNGLSNQEKALLFLMMDLSSCIQDETKPPAPPPPVIR